MRPKGIRRRHDALASALVVVLAAAGSGCVTFYQPMRAIHRPVAVEASPRNFEGLRILVRCLSTDDFSTSDAGTLCSKIGEDLEKQGALVETYTPSRTDTLEPDVFEGQRPDLTVEILSRNDHAYYYPLTWGACCVTCSLVPIMFERTDSQRIVVYGRDRSVLAEETYRERFVNYVGCSVWSVNWIADWIFRDDHQQVMDDAGKKQFTRDFYGQVRQLTMNARVRSEVLGLTKPRDRPRVVDEAAAPPTTTPAAPPATGAPATETGGTPGGVTGGVTGFGPSSTTSDSATPPAATVEPPSGDPAEPEEK